MFWLCDNVCELSTNLGKFFEMPKIIHGELVNCQVTFLDILKTIKIISG